MNIPSWLAGVLGNVNLGVVVVWATIIVLTFIAVRKVWPVVKAIVQFADTWSKLPGFMKRTDESIEMMQQQILNNHPEDSNMREEITEAKNAANRAVELAEGLHGRVDALQASDERQEQMLADHGATLEAVDKKLLKDHQRLGDLEDTLPKRQVRELTAGDRDE